MGKKGIFHRHEDPNDLNGRHRQYNDPQRDVKRFSDGDFLELKDLVVEYTSSGRVIHAVNGVSLKLARGETLGLVGETGAGKTTIAKAILGVLPDPPAKVRAGHIYIEGEDLLTKPEKDMLKIRGEKISMIFQDPMTALNPILSVGEQICEGILLHGERDRKKAQKQARHMLELVGIPEERYVEYPHQFSGGMKQRVVIAMALACQPELLLADEPTTALDVTIQAQILDLLKELKEKFNTAMILITHDLGVVGETCDNVAVIYAGQIVESGTKKDIYKDTRHPYTVGLFGAIPKLDDKSRRLNPVPGLPPDPTDLPAGCPFGPRCPRFCDKCAENSIPFTEVSPGHFVRCLDLEVIKNGNTD